MTPDAPAPPPPATLLVKAPPDPVFLPLVATAARTFAGSLPDAGGLVGQVERRVTEVFGRAATAGGGPISVTLRYAPPTLEAVIAPVEGEELVLRFARE